MHGFANLPVRRQVMVLCVGSLVMIATVARSQPAPTTDWEAPAHADHKQNPIPADAKSIAQGKEVYKANCLTCHGASGRGDGPSSSGLDRKPGNLTDTVRMGRQSDGALFWKIGEGRGPMPQWKDAITDEDRWNVINYVRTLAVKK